MPPILADDRVMRVYFYLSPTDQFLSFTPRNGLVQICRSKRTSPAVQTARSTGEPRRYNSDKLFSQLSPFIFEPWLSVIRRFACKGSPAFLQKAVLPSLATPFSVNLCKIVEAFSRRHSRGGIPEEASWRRRSERYSLVLLPLIATTERH